MTIAEEVRALRAALKEDTATFAARWLKSGRTIEDWEQGRREPDAFVLEAMRALAVRTKKRHGKRAPA
jgi:DNA-binding transcriptional regulator YiaG